MRVSLVMVSVYAVLSFCAGHGPLSAAVCREVRADAAAHSKNVGQRWQDAHTVAIFALSLSFIPVLPSAVIGSAAVIMSKRCNTPARKRLLFHDVTAANWAHVDAQCAKTLAEKPLGVMDLRGTPRTALAIAITAIVLCLVATVPAIFFFERHRKFMKDVRGGTNEVDFE